MCEKENLYIDDTRKFKKPCGSCSWRFTTFGFCQKCVHYSGTIKSDNEYYSKVFYKSQLATIMDRKYRLALEYISDAKNWVNSDTLKRPGMDPKSESVRMMMSSEIHPRVFAQMVLRGGGKDVQG